MMHCTNWRQQDRWVIEIIVDRDKISMTILLMRQCKESSQGEGSGFGFMFACLF